MAKSIVPYMEYCTFQDEWTEELAFVERVCLICNNAIIGSMKQSNVEWHIDTHYATFVSQ